MNQSNKGLEAIDVRFNGNRFVGRIDESSLSMIQK